MSPIDKEKLAFLLSEQFYDDRLWTPVASDNTREGYLQNALRLMHAAVEEYVFHEDNEFNKMYLAKKRFYASDNN